jgi:asparagine synthase (glutamine-hydrolysing)
MSEALRHRGPDGHGLWQASTSEVVFGHRRLAIIDLSEAGAQPMVDEETGCVVTYNGEIYNFLEIRRDLEALGETFRSACDTEVILKAHKRWGLDAVARYRGIFALALWDPRAGAVHLARDPMGIKPLYWTTVRDGETGEEVLLFASEVRALLASGVVRRSLDPAAVASYLWHGFVVGPSTIVADVQLLPAASILTLEAGDGRGPNTKRLRQYWHMPSSRGRAQTPADLREELLRTLEMQLISDVPLGVFLSGGVDSSAVAALAAEVASDTLHTFTIGFDEAEYDETAYAQRVADAIGSRHTRMLLSQDVFRLHLGDALTAIDQPTFDGVNSYFVSRAVRDAGMTVALAGTGGDELFGGYTSYVDIPRALRATGWIPVNGVARQAADGAWSLLARLASDLSWNVMGVAPPQTRWGKIADVARAAHDVFGLYQVSYALFTRESQARLAGSAIRQVQRQQQYGLPATVAESWRKRVEGSELLHAVSVLELSSFIGERLLRDTDSVSMAVALEVRVPLLDHVLAETVAGIEPEQRFAPVGKKKLLRDVALSGLDPAIFDRPKSGFVLPIDVWARQDLQREMDALLSDPQAAGKVGLQGETVRTLWQSFLAGRAGLYWSRIWALYILLWWCQAHELTLDS